MLQIRERAEQEGVDGIVVGTRGMRPVKSLVLGSVAAGVIQCARRPVNPAK